MKIVAFGDSITYGDTGDHKQPHPRRWTTLLAEKTGHEVVNAGVNGDTTRLALERFPKDVQESGADVVLIQFGYNDCNHWDTDKGLPRVFEDATIANIVEMEYRAQHFGARAIVIKMHTTRRNPYSRWQGTLKRRMEWDLYGVTPPRGLELPDGLHLSSKDNERYADKIATWL